MSAERFFPDGRFRGLLSAALLASSVALSGCAAGGIVGGVVGSGGSPDRFSPPDAAAVEAGAHARAVFERGRRPAGSPALRARVEEVGRRAVAEFFGEFPGPAPVVASADSGDGNGDDSGNNRGNNRDDRGGGDGEGDGSGAPPAGAEGWRFVVTDEAAPEAHLFADGSVFVSSGALAAVGSERALGALFRAAAACYAAGAFRDPARALVPQPIAVPLPGPNSGEGISAEGVPRDDESWVALLDGLAFGAPPEHGGARGRDLFLPSAGLRLRAPPGYLFAPGEGGRHAAARGDALPDLVVEELAVEAGSGGSAPADDGSVGAERRRLRVLGDHLLRRANGRSAGLLEVVRSGGVRGVATRLAPPGGNPGFLALLDAPGGVVPGNFVEVRRECGGSALAACENSFMAMLRSAAPDRGGTTPGRLRLRAARVSRPRPAREALEAFVRDGTSEVPAFVLHELNRARLDEEVAPGALLLVARRDPASDYDRSRTASGRVGR